ncbi:MAG: DsbA family protein [Gammaproteobacteria bacterium]|nr:DsbA family protein [Gammaproteobacteria bacterium]
MNTLYYFHDPMCSWCWGYRPESQLLFDKLPKGVTRVNVLGGLAPDSDEPMPAALREAIPGTWRRIENLLGTKFNYDFWTKCAPRRSTYPACRAVIAAAKQGAEEEMIHAIQRAYYLQARNPSDLEMLAELAAEIGLDRSRFVEDIRSAGVEDELQRQIAFALQAPISGFPSLALEAGSRLHPVAVDYQDHRRTLDEIGKLVA